MKRLLALALVAGSLAAVAAPATAAPYCGRSAGVKCTPDGSRYCLVYVATPKSDVCV